MDPKRRLIPLAVASAFLFLHSCGQKPGPGLIPESDLTPPLVVSAAPEGESTFSLTFSEDIIPVADSFFLEPGPKKAEAKAFGRELDLDFGEPFHPGEEYRVAGEVEDRRGNSTRFVFSFTGWNARPARMLLSEVQTGKTSSKASPHRDYVELRVLGAGNLGGMEIAWSSSVKTCRYVFPGVEVASGDYIVLHLAPEGIAEEKDEKGSDLALSGGIDAKPEARDFWCSDGALPDENGAIRLSERPGGEIMDMLVYAAEDKSGPMKEDKLSAFVKEGSGSWKVADPPVWEDAFRRKFSPTRSIARKLWPETGAPASMDRDFWYLCDSGCQSPGSDNIPNDPARASAKSRKAGR